MPIEYAKAVTPLEYARYYIRKLPPLFRDILPDTVAVAGLSLLQRFGFLKPDLLIMPYLELCITPLCSLCCKKCANFMHLYGRSSHYETAALLRSFDKLMDSVDSVSWFRILGGEPFLHPDLGNIVRHCAASGKIDHVEIVTNGTIVPSDWVVTMLRETRSTVYISNYGSVSRKKDSLIKTLEQNGIPFECEDILGWEDMGDGERFEYSEKQARAVYGTCLNICKTLVNGELHICPRSAHGTALGLIRKCPEDYVDVVGASSQEALRAAVRALYDVDCIEACYHCIGPKRSPIPAGEQLGKGEE